MKKSKGTGYGEAVERKEETAQLCRASFKFCTFSKIRPICACQLDSVPYIQLILKLFSKKS